MAVQQRSRCILVPDANVVKQYPMWGKGEPIYYWAERGLVNWERAETDTYGTLTVRDACQRVSALSDMVILSSEDPRWAHERRMLQKFIHEMESVIRQAKEQGEPDNPDTRKDAERRRKKMSIGPRTIGKIVTGDLKPGRDYLPGPPPEPTPPL